MLLPYRLALVIVTVALSLPTPSLASPLDALSQCLKEGLRGDPPIRKVGTTHSPDVDVNIVCYGKSAETLYGIIKNFSNQDEGTDDDLNKQHIRFFGDSSQCVDTYETPSGKPLQQFSCYIKLDLNAKVVAALGGAL
jgi:hypothetical protein